MFSLPSLTKYSSFIARFTAFVLVSLRQQKNSCQRILTSGKGHTMIRGSFLRLECISCNHICPQFRPTSQDNRLSFPSQIFVDLFFHVCVGVTGELLEETVVVLIDYSINGKTGHTSFLLEMIYQTKQTEKGTRVRAWLRGRESRRYLIEDLGDIPPVN